MLTTVLCLLFCAQAREPYAELYPWAVTLGGTENRPFLYDVAGKPLSTRAALDYLGDPTVSKAYKQRTTERIAGSAALWVGGAALCLGGTQISDLRSDTPRQVVMLSGLVLAGGGFAVRFSGPGRRLGDWVDRHQLETAIEAHGQATLSPASQADAERLTSEVERLELTLSPRGRLLDREGEIVPIDVFAVRMGDEQTAMSYRRERGRYRRTFLPMMWGGASLTYGGVAVAGVGALMNAESRGGAHTSDVIPVIGAATALAGAGLFGGGLVGWLHARSEVEDPAYWYGTNELPSRLRGYNNGLRDALVGPKPLHVDLIVAPGSVAFTGTF
jgi:hypothetical protein